MIAYFKRIISKSKLEPVDSEVTLTQPAIYKDTKKEKEKKKEKKKNNNHMTKHAAEYLSLK